MEIGRLKSFGFYVNKVVLGLLILNHRFIYTRREIVITENRLTEVNGCETSLEIHLLDKQLL